MIYLTFGRHKIFGFIFKIFPDYWGWSHSAYCIYNFRYIVNTYFSELIYLKYWSELKLKYNHWVASFW